MVSVLISSFNREKNGEVIYIKGDIRIEVTGHSGISVKGSDVVCAGISAIVESAVLAITRVAGIRQKIKQKSGYLETVVASTDLDKEKIRDLLVIISTMLVGLDEIKKLFPEALNINFINN